MGPIIPVTPTIRSPKASKGPLPTPPNPQLKSPLILLQPKSLDTPNIFRPFSPLTQPGQSPSGLRAHRNSIASESSKPSKRRRRRRDSALPSSVSKQLNGPITSDRSLQHGLRAVDAPRSEIQGLNPLATSFQPVNRLKERVLSPPVKTPGNIDEHLASMNITSQYQSPQAGPGYIDPDVPSHLLFAFPSVGSLHSQKPAHIREDLSHICQWFNLHNNPFAIAKQREQFFQLQRQQLQRDTSMVLGPPCDGFGTTQGPPFPFSPGVMRPRSSPCPYSGYQGHDASKLHPDMPWSSQDTYQSSSSSGSSHENLIPLVTPYSAPVSRNIEENERLIRGASIGS